MREEGLKDMGKEETKESVTKVRGHEKAVPPPPPAYVAHTSYLTREVQPQHTQWPSQPQHEHACQSTASPPRGSGNEERDGEGGGIGLVTWSPSFLPVPTPLFREHFVQTVFAEEGREGRLEDSVESSPEAVGGESFMENDKEVTYLFKDGDLDSW